MAFLDTFFPNRGVHDAINVGQGQIVGDVQNHVKEGLFGNTVYHKAKQGFNINEFHAEINAKKGLMKPSLFLVSIDFTGDPQWVRDATNRTTRQSIPFFCNSAVIPGIAFANADIKNEGWGSLDRRPYAAVMSDPTFTFMLDSEGSILNFFHTWSRNIVNYNAERGMDGAVDEAFTWETFYRDNYLCNITVATFDPVGNKVHTYKLFECYPSVIGDVELAWASTDQFSQLSTTFQTRYWTSDTYPIPQLGSGRGAGIFEFMAKTLAGGFANLPGSILGGNLSVQDALNTAANAVLKKVNVFGDIFGN